MKPILFKFLLCLSIVISLSFIDRDQKIYQKQYNKQDIVEVSINNQKHYLSLDDYLLGVIAGEIPASFEIEAIKAQILASRTFVYSRLLKVDNTTNSQVYLTEKQMIEKWDTKYQEYKDKIMKCIEETKGEIITYQGKCIQALFYSSSNGKSENVENYFQGSPVSYLVSVDSSWDKEVDKNFIRNKYYSQKQLDSLFHQPFKYSNIIRYPSGRIKSIKINDQIYSGRKIREMLELSSSDFTIQQSNNGYIFQTKGSGHGVGMSQYGMQAMALKGYNYKEIIQHYYRGTTISKNKE